MQKLIKRSLLTQKYFIALLCEIEAVVNNKPLTYLYNETNFWEILRPTDFLTPLRSILLPAQIDSNTNKEGYIPSNASSAH